jgi:hypothetical protein
VKFSETLVTFHETIFSEGSRDGSVGIATGYRLRDRDSILGGVEIHFFFSADYKKLLRLVQPPIQWAPLIFRWG